MWRPKNWKKCIKPSSKNTYTTDDLSHMYETGADAMLETLRNDGFRLGSGYSAWQRVGKEILLKWRENDEKGYLVFIPDEE